MVKVKLEFYEKCWEYMVVKVNKGVSYDVYGSGETPAEAKEDAINNFGNQLDFQD